MTPRVSVVVASYNYGRYIAEALASIQKQTFEDWEAIVVDDGSTDDSLAIIGHFLTDRRFRLVCNPHLGQPQTKNCGILASSGGFIAFLDADDRWASGKLDRQVSLFDKQPKVGVCYTRRQLIDGGGHLIAGDGRPFHRGQVLDAIFRDNFVCFSSAMVRRSFLEQVGLFDERLALGIDYELWLRLARVCKFDYIDEPLVQYRTGHANLSQRLAERLDSAIAVMHRFCRDIDLPAQLSPAARRQAFAETFRHRALIARRTSTWKAIGWSMRSLAISPFAPLTWLALLGSLVPISLRRTVRNWRGKHDWEVVTNASRGSIAA
ncbi:MAG: glycosyltransferase [Gemmataceae bacterium]